MRGGGLRGTEHRATREISASVSQQELTDALHSLREGASLAVVARHGGRVQVQAGDLFRIAVSVDALNDDELERVDRIMSAAGREVGADYDLQDVIHLRALEQLVLTLEPPPHEAARLALEIARKGMGPTLTVLSPPAPRAKVIPLFPESAADDE